MAFAITSLPVPVSPRIRTGVLGAFAIDATSSMNKYVTGVKDAVE
jgi:hypothetical protein